MDDDPIYHMFLFANLTQGRASRPALATHPTLRNFEIVSPSSITFSITSGCQMVQFRWRSRSRRPAHAGSWRTAAAFSISRCG